MEVTPMRVNVTSSYDEVTSRRVDVTWSCVDVTSRRLDVTSSYVEVTSRRVDVTSLYDGVTLTRADRVLTRRGEVCRAGSAQGSMMRPGASCVPASVWQELQSPVVMVVSMLRTCPLYSTRAFIGVPSLA